MGTPIGQSVVERRLSLGALSLGSAVEFGLFRKNHWTGPSSLLY